MPLSMYTDNENLAADHKALHDSHVSVVVTIRDSGLNIGSQIRSE